MQGSSPCTTKSMRYLVRVRVRVRVRARVRVRVRVRVGLGLEVDAVLLDDVVQVLVRHHVRHALDHLCTRHGGG
eukprot:scaffold132165_cov33-Phaeocystis_antarctica.AAC.1